MLRKFLAATGFIASISFSGDVLAIPTSQVDEITLGGATYQGDVWTLTLTGPVSGSVAYTVTLADVSGCNVCNAILGWGTAINNDAVIGNFLTATFELFDGVNSIDPVITLTADTAGVPFTASVSVFEASNSDFNEIDDLTVSIETIVRASSATVSEPGALGLLGIGLIGVVGTRQRRRFR